MMNNDLISREDMKKALKSNCIPELCHDYGTNWCEACCRTNDFEDLIDNAPTVEAKTTADCIIAYGDGYETARRLSERPKGKWLHDKLCLDVKCSICNSYALERGDYPELSKYCPACGAEMEIEK